MVKILTDFWFTLIVIVNVNIIYFSKSQSFYNDTSNVFAQDVKIDTIRCGELLLVHQAVYFGGHSKSCFRAKPIPFIACKALLLQSGVECSALSYTEGKCWLHDRRSPYWTRSSKSKHTTRIVRIHKLIEFIDGCKEYSLYSESLTKQFQMCKMKELNLRTDFNTLPKLAIVLSATLKWTKANMEELLSVKSNYECYAKTHGYQFYVNILKDIHHSGKYWHDRHEYIVTKYLPYYQYILVVDTDTFILNLSQSLDKYINSQKDLIFHMREGGEIAASAYFIRNSLFSYCFVRLWSTMIPPIHLLPNFGADDWISTPNFDNGDLVYTVMVLINETAALRCASKVKHRTQTHLLYDYGMLRCFRVFRGSFLRMDIYRPEIQIYFIREGFFRMHLGDESSSPPIQLKDRSCHKHDILAHGWRAIGRKFWNIRNISQGIDFDDLSRSSLTDDTFLSLGSSPNDLKSAQTMTTQSILTLPAHPYCDIHRIRGGFGRNPHCCWLSPQEELDIVMDKCYWRSPLCTENDKNICLERGNCELEVMNLQRWYICEQHGICDPSTGPKRIKNYVNRTVFPLDWLTTSFHPN